MFEYRMAPEAVGGCVTFLLRFFRLAESCQQDDFEVKNNDGFKIWAQAAGEMGSGLGSPCL